MQTTNDLMTEEQVTDLLNLAAELQAKAESSNDRDTAVMAYAVQKVCLELTESRIKSKASEQQLAAVVAENAGLKAAAKETLAHWAAAEPGQMELMMDKCMPALRDAYCDTPATDANLAEVRAKGAELAGEYLKQYAQSVHEEARLVLQDAGELCNGFAAQLRQGAAL